MIITNSNTDNGYTGGYVDFPSYPCYPIYVLWIPCPRCGTYSPENSYCSSCNCWVGSRKQEKECYKYCPYCGKRLK